jgi:hypothetical protein
MKPNFQKGGKISKKESQFAAYFFKTYHLNHPLSMGQQVNHGLFMLEMELRKSTGNH